MALTGEQESCLNEIVSTLERISTLVQEYMSCAKLDDKFLTVNARVYFAKDEGYLESNVNGEIEVAGGGVHRMLASKLTEFLTQAALNELIPQRLREIEAEVDRLADTLYQNLTGFMPQRQTNLRIFADTASILLEDAWRIIANAGGGNWSNESAEWQVAANTFRERYHAAIGPLKRQAAEQPKDLPDASTAVQFVDGGDPVLSEDVRRRAKEFLASDDWDSALALLRSAMGG